MSCVCYVLCGGRVSAALAAVGGRQPSGSASVQVALQPMQILTKFDGEGAPLLPPLTIDRLKIVGCLFPRYAKKLARHDISYRAGTVASSTTLARSRRLS